VNNATLASLVGGLVLAQAASAATIYGTTSTGQLARFDSATPGTIQSSLLITDSVSGNAAPAMVGIDFRPSTGELFGLSQTNVLYTINPDTAVATRVTPVTGAGTTLNGSAFGFDFNPRIDRIRVVSEADSNYVYNPATGTGQQVDGINIFPLAYALGDPNFGTNPNVVASAYDRNALTDVGTQLFGIDSGLNVLVKQANSAGTLTTVGPLGWDPTSVIGFDIETGTGVAYSAMVDSSGVSRLYTINLITGANTLVGQINGGLFLTTLTVAIPEPTTLSVLAAGALLTRRRRA
jgi:Domain of unknown function (DUF4394)